MTDGKIKTVAVIGSGPAGLMAAFVLAQAGCHVHVFEKKRGPGRKLLVAGSSGLNVTFDAPLADFCTHYRAPPDRILPVLAAFPPESWLAFIHERGLKTFKGTSGRYFVDGLKASTLLRAWLKDLSARGVKFSYGCELRDFKVGEGTVHLDFTNGTAFDGAAAVFALGGASWEKTETPLRWPPIFERKGIALTPFRASNVGYRVDWPAPFLALAEGKPLKNVALTTSKGTKRGDLIVTRYGLEGTPIYTLGETGTAYLDLKPDLTTEQIRKKLLAVTENRLPLRRVKKQLNLGPATLALVSHLTPPDALANLEKMTAHLKRFPLALLGPQPIQEAISSSGGIKWEELDLWLMLKKFPGIFVAGEMLDWDAPTGGFLIQGCVSLGRWAGKAAARLEIFK